MSSVTPITFYFPDLPQLHAPLWWSILLRLAESYPNMQAKNYAALTKALVENKTNHIDKLEGTEESILMMLVKSPHDAIKQYLELLQKSAIFQSRVREHGEAVCMGAIAAQAVLLNPDIEVLRLVRGSPFPYPLKERLASYAEIEERRTALQTEGEQLIKTMCSDKRLTIQIPKSWKPPEYSDEAVQYIFDTWLK